VSDGQRARVILRRCSSTKLTRVRTLSTARARWCVFFPVVGPAPPRLAVAAPQLRVPPPAVRAAAARRWGARGDAY
jgi:hypothetical protein